MHLFVVSEQNLSGQFASRTHVIEFCSSMAKLVHVSLLSYTDPASIQESLQGPPQFELIRQEPVRLPVNNLAYLLSTIKLFFTLRTISRMKKIDALYVRAIPFGIGPLWFARLNKIPAVLEINGVWDEEQKLSFSLQPKWKRWIIKPILELRSKTMDYACHIADLLIAVTPNIAVYLQSKGMSQEKIRVVSNGVNTNQFTPLDRLECRKRLGLPEEVFLIGYVGSLSAWQGVESLLEAMALLREKYSDQIKALIIGDGPQRQLLENIHAEKSLNGMVDFLGSKPYALIPWYIAACDVLVAPKKPLSSGYSPLKIYEYLACGRPVLASEVIGLEFIAQNELGLLFAPGNEFDLSQKLMKLYEMTDEDRRQIGQHAREFVVQYHSWDSVTTAIWDATRKFLKNINL